VAPHVEPAARARREPGRDRRRRGRRLASFGPEGFDQRAADGELYAINVRPDRWGVGAGRALLAAVHARLADFGYRSAVLWVAPGNQRARAVYERYGWCSEGVEHTAEVLGVTVPDVPTGVRWTVRHPTPVVGQAAMWSLLGGGQARVSS
jgi:GNAT superfamily N-acetyltransferase